MKRIIYTKVIKTMQSGFIPLIVGMRRLGKTTILKQIGDEFGNFKYYTCDDYDIASLNDQQFFKMVEAEIQNGTNLFLFDEIQERNSWGLFLKLLFDKYVSNGIIKVIATGSSTIEFENKDVGADRVQRILISTLTYHEYLELTNQTHSEQVFEKYLGSGGFPGWINNKLENSNIANKVILPILNIDLPRFYGIKGENVIKVMDYISKFTNGEINRDKICKILQMSWAQVDSYINMLIKSHLLIKVNKVNEKGIKPIYEKYKLYINPHILLALTNKTFDSCDDKMKGLLIESYYLYGMMHVKDYYDQYFYLKFDKTNQEIDIVKFDPLNNKFNYLIEFKYSKNATLQTYNQMWSINSGERIVYCKETIKKDGIEFKSIYDLRFVNSI